MDDPSAPGPLVLLIHGGWADGSCWSGVISELGKRGLAVAAPQLTLKTFEEDVEIVRRRLRMIRTSVILVGHSYGGAVVTELAMEPQVKALIYLAGAAPTTKEPFGVTMSRFAGEHQPALVSDPDGWLWATRETFAEGLAQDLPPEAHDFLAAVQKPVSPAVFSGVSSNRNRLSKPCWYLVSENDRLLAPEGQRRLAEEIGAVCLSTPSGHMLPLSAQGVVVDLIAAVLEAVTA